MAQVKKPEAREAILQAAFGLFSQHDYASVTIAQIARRAHLSTSNIYVYFASKLDILWAVMSPWLFRQIELLDAELAVIAEPRARIERILTALWGDIPSADNNLSLNLLQALALSGPNDRYSGELLAFLQKRVTRMLADCLPAERRHVLGERDAFAHLAFMAFDGFALNTRLNGRSDNLQQIVRITTDMLLGVTDPTGPRRADSMPQPAEPAAATSSQ